MILEDNGPIESSPLHPIELTDPWPAPHEIRIKVEASAVCRTDLHIIEGELPLKRRPIVPGHQAVGLIDMVGRKVARFREGQRVGIAWLRHTCGSCLYCGGGQENLCEASEYTGYHADGGFAQYAVADESFVYEIPKSLDPAAAAPLLCAGIIGYRALRRAQVPQGGALGLFGFGSSAHIVMQVAKARGSQIYVVTRGESHRTLAKKMGADWVGSSAFELPRKLDSAILFAPAGELVPQALSSIRKGGTVALAGIYLSKIPQLDYESHLFYEKNLHSVTSNTRADGLEFLAEAAARSILPHVTKFPLDRANEVLQMLKSDKLQGSAVLIP